jgi:hypothetical protein
MNTFFTIFIVALAAMLLYAAFARVKQPKKNHEKFTQSHKPRRRR